MSVLAYMFCSFALARQKCCPKIIMRRYPWAVINLVAVCGQIEEHLQLKDVYYIPWMTLICKWDVLRHFLILNFPLLVKFITNLEIGLIFVCNKFWPIFKHNEIIINNRIEWPKYIQIFIFVRKCNQSTLFMTPSSLWRILLFYCLHTHPWRTGKRQYCTMHIVNQFMIHFIVIICINWWSHFNSFLVFIVLYKLISICEFTLNALLLAIKLLFITLLPFFRGKEWHINIVQTLLNYNYGTVAVCEFVVEVNDVGKWY